MPKDDETQTEEATSLSYKDDPDFLPWLKTQEGFADLFSDPTPAKAAAPVEGGGQKVIPQKAEATMSDEVARVTSAMAEGLVKGLKGTPATSTLPGAPTGPQEPPKRTGLAKAFWGE